MMKFRAHGKLLLSAEYLVLEGAMALAVPVKYSQWLKAYSHTETSDWLISWEARENKKSWFNALFDKDHLIVKETSDFLKAEKLRKWLLSAEELNSKFLKDNRSYRVITEVDFPVDWGLGASSTIIKNIADWAGINPFDLHFKTSEGSGYDIASAIYDSPIIYQNKPSGRSIKEVKFYPPFHNQLFFVYLGRKQNSVVDIEYFRKNNKTVNAKHIRKVNVLTEKMLNASALEDFNRALVEHELLIAELLDAVPVKQSLYGNFQGEIKSLGAWGGDFALVTWKGQYNDLKKYFEEKGLNTIIRFREMVL